MNKFKTMSGVTFFAVLCLLCSASAATDDVEARLADLVDKLISTAQLPGKTAIAVLPFESGLTRNPKAGVGVAEYLITLLQANPMVELVDRVQLKKAMEELALSQSGAIAEDKMLALGRMLAAKYLIAGSLTDALGKAMINSRLIETETGKIIASATASLGAEVLTSFSKEVLGEKTQVSATIFRSALVPGWGQFYTNHPVWGGTMLTGFLVSAGGAVWSFVEAAKKAGVYNDFKSGTYDTAYQQELIEEWFGPGVTRNSPQFDQARFNLLWKQRETDLWNDFSAKNGNGVLWTIITGGVWTINMANAAILGEKTKNKVNLYFSATPRSAGVLMVFSY